MRTCNVYQKTNLRPANELFREAKLVEEKYVTILEGQQILPDLICDFQTQK